MYNEPSFFFLSTTYFFLAATVFIYTIFWFFSCFCFDNKKIGEGSGPDATGSLQTTMSLLVLSSSDVDAITSTFSPQDLLLLMAEVFTLISSKEGRERVSMPPRIVIPTLHHTALFMPAHISTRASDEDPDRPSSGFTLGGTAVKVVCVPAKSDLRGLPGTTLVLDEVTGGVKAVVNARNLTALRNAAGPYITYLFFHEF